MDLIEILDPTGELGEVERPLVLVTTSSEFQDDGRLVRCALDALAGEELHVVATVPASASVAFDVPANAHVASFVPHGAILDRACCAITHGGMGATQKALARGVPVCAVPFGRDQFEVARRVEYAGAGTRLPSRRLDAARLRDAVAIVATGAVTTATRDVVLDGTRVRAGDYLGLLGDEPIAGGDRFSTVAEAVVEQLLAEPHDVLTLLVGADEPSLDDLLRRIEERHPELELEVHSGGQPLYQLLIAAE